MMLLSFSPAFLSRYSQWKAFVSVLRIKFLELLRVLVSARAILNLLAVPSKRSLVKLGNDVSVIIFNIIRVSWCILSFPYKQLSYEDLRRKSFNPMLSKINLL